MPNVESPNGEIFVGPGAAVLVARESIIVGAHSHEIRRVVRYRIAGDRFTECWLYEENQAVIDQGWVDPPPSRRSA